MRYDCVSVCVPPSGATRTSAYTTAASSSSSPTTKGRGGWAETYEDTQHNIVDWVAPSDVVAAHKRHKGHQRDDPGGPKHGWRVLCAIQAHQPLGEHEHNRAKAFAGYVHMGGGLNLDEGCDRGDGYAGKGCCDGEDNLGGKDAEHFSNKPCADLLVHECAVRARLCRATSSRGQSILVLFVRRHVALGFRTFALRTNKATTHSDETKQQWLMRKQDGCCAIVCCES